MCLQGYRCQGNAGPSNPEHHGQKLVGQIQLISPRTILSHQQPAGEALFNPMEVVTRRRCRQLAHRNIDIALQALM